MKKICVNLDDWYMFIYQSDFFTIKFLVLKLYVKGVNFSICFLLIINVSRETFTYMF